MAFSSWENSHNFEAEKYASFNVDEKKAKDLIDFIIHVVEFTIEVEDALT